MTSCVIPSTLEKGGKTVSQRQILDCSGARGWEWSILHWDTGTLLRMMDVINTLNTMVVTQFKHLSKLKLCTWKGCILWFVNYTLTTCTLKSAILQCYTLYKSCFKMFGASLLETCISLILVFIYTYNWLGLIWFFFFYCFFEIQ